MIAWSQIPWYGKLILGAGVVLLLVTVYQQGQIQTLKKFKTQ